MQVEPGTRHSAPHYYDVVGEVLAYLECRFAACVAAGIARDRLILDPGIGFGKTVDHNLALLRALPRFHGLGCPLLIGVSRKSFIGAIAGEPDPPRRLPGSLAVALHDRKRVLEGKGVSVRVDLGGRRSLRKK